MAEKLKLELQDENGNVYHLHTSADIVFLEDGTTVEAALTKKVTAAGGDIANTIVSAIDASTASFPVPAAKDKPRTLWGKVKKWQEDCIAKFGNYVLKSMISSQQINDSSKVPSSALAYLMQQAITENANDISVLNTKLFVDKDSTVNRVKFYTTENGFIMDVFDTPETYFRMAFSKAAMLISFQRYDGATFYTIFTK